MASVNFATQQTGGSSASSSTPKKSNTNANLKDLPESMDSPDLMPNRTQMRRRAMSAQVSVIFDALPRSFADFQSRVQENIHLMQQNIHNRSASNMKKSNSSSNMKKSNSSSKIYRNNGKSAPGENNDNPNENITTYDLLSIYLKFSQVSADGSTGGTSQYPYQYLPGQKRSIFWTYLWFTIVGSIAVSYCGFVYYQSEFNFDYFVKNMRKNFEEKTADFAELRSMLTLQDRNKSDKKGDSDSEESDSVKNTFFGIREKYFGTRENIDKFFEKYIEKIDIDNIFAGKINWSSLTALQSSFYLSGSSALAGSAAGFKYPDLFAEYVKTTCEEELKKIKDSEENFSDREIANHKKFCEADAKQRFQTDEIEYRKSYRPPHYVIPLLASWIYLCIVFFGLRFMSNRSSDWLGQETVYETLFIYDCFHVIINLGLLLIAIEGYANGISKSYRGILSLFSSSAAAKFSYLEDTSSETVNRAIHLSTLLWFHYQTRIFELFDIIFIIINKKFVNEYSLFHLHMRLCGLWVWFMCARYFYYCTRCYSSLFSGENKQFLFSDAVYNNLHFLVGVQVIVNILVYGYYSIGLFSRIRASRKFNDFFIARIMSQDQKKHNSRDGPNSGNKNSSNRKSNTGGKRRPKKSPRSKKKNNPNASKSNALARTVSEDPMTQIISEDSFSKVAGSSENLTEKTTSLVDSMPSFIFNIQMAEYFILFVHGLYSSIMAVYYPDQSTSNNDLSGLANGGYDAPALVIGILQMGIFFQSLVLNFDFHVEDDSYWESIQIKFAENLQIPNSEYANQARKLAEQVLGKNYFIANKQDGTFESREDYSPSKYCSKKAGCSSETKKKLKNLNLDFHKDIDEEDLDEEQLREKRLSCEATMVMDINNENSSENDRDSENSDSDDSENETENEGEMSKSSKKSVKSTSSMKKGRNSHETEWDSPLKVTSSNKKGRRSSTKSEKEDIEAKRSDILQTTAILKTPENKNAGNSTNKSTAKKGKKSTGKSNENENDEGDIVISSKTSNPEPPIATNSPPKKSLPGEKVVLDASVPRFVVSFDSSGWLYLYHLGVAFFMEDHFGVQRGGKFPENFGFSGASGGALVACMLACGISIWDVVNDVISSSDRCRYDPIETFRTCDLTLTKFLRPENWKPAQGRLRILMTQMSLRPPFFKGKVATVFKNYKHLWQILRASCHIPFVGGPLPYKVEEDGRRYIDGLLWFSLFVFWRGWSFKKDHVVKVSAVSAPTADIGPHRLLPIWWALFPPDQDVLWGVFWTGYLDAMTFFSKEQSHVKRRGLFCCGRVRNRNNHTSHRDSKNVPSLGRRKSFSANSDKIKPAKKLPPWKAFHALPTVVEPIKREITEEIEDLIALADEHIEHAWIKLIFLLVGGFILALLCTVMWDTYFS